MLLHDLLVILLLLLGRGLLLAHLFLRVAGLQGLVLLLAFDTSSWALFGGLFVFLLLRHHLHNLLVLVVTIINLNLLLTSLNLIHVLVVILFLALLLLELADLLSKKIELVLLNDL